MPSTIVDQSGLVGIHVPCGPLNKAQRRPSAGQVLHIYEGLAAARQALALEASAPEAEQEETEPLQEAAAQRDEALREAARTAMAAGEGVFAFPSSARNPCVKWVVCVSTLLWSAPNKRTSCCSSAQASYYVFCCIYQWDHAESDDRTLLH